MQRALIVNKVLVVAMREYKAAVHTKSFLVSVLLMPVMMFGGAGVQVLLQSHPDTKDKVFAVIDRTPGELIYPLLQKAAEKRNETKVFDPDTKRQIKSKFILEKVSPQSDIKKQRLELSNQVRDEKYWGFLEIGPDVCKAAVPGVSSREGPKKAEEDDGRALRYQTSHVTSEDFPQWAQTQLLLAVMGKRMGVTLDEESLNQSASLALKREGLSEERNGEIVDPPLLNQIARFIVPAALVALMFMMIMLSSTPAMHGVVEEKMQKIAEVLLGSLSPFQLMLGKLAGLMSVSLTVAAVYLGGAYWAANHYGVAETLPVPILLWFVVFQVLAILMYGSLYLAVGAAASDTKETQTLVMPIIMVVCIPMFILRSALEDPNSPMVMGASFFPPITPMLMMARIAISPGPIWWQPYLAVVLTLAVTALCVYAAGRIFRVGILMQGKGARISQLVQWIIHG
jgi:ABC-2 type transport system permease protein